MQPILPNYYTLLLLETPRFRNERHPGVLLALLPATWDDFLVVLVALVLLVDPCLSFL